jgi:hypothetical protein
MKTDTLIVLLAEVNSAAAALMGKNGRTPTCPPERVAALVEPASIEAMANKLDHLPGRQRLAA